MQPGWPEVGEGQSVGLLGGSFDPAHAGHVRITHEALARFGLDWVWWLVTPGNPLKPNPPAPLSDRIAAAGRIMRHPRVRITGIEADLGTRYTAGTLAALQRRYPRARFVWLMGADNLAGFHHWDRWEEIMAQVPVGVLARPGQRLPALLSPAARRFGGARVAEPAALAQRDAPGWCFVNMPMLDVSSSAIRAAGEGRDGAQGN